MLKDITLGQYFPGNPLAHRLDPRVKIVLVIIYVVGLFSANFLISYGIMVLMLALAISVSKVKMKALLNGLRPILIIVILTAILNLFYTPGEEIFSWWVISVTKEGVVRAALMVLRIVMLIMGTFLLTYTTSPIKLTSGIESQLSPLKKLHFPVHELALMMSIALRFIPTLIEETDKIMSAQKARGANFEDGSLIQRAKALVPLLVPLFVSAFRRADELSVAMECRCYHGGEGSTKLHVLRCKKEDYFVLIGAVALIAAVIVISKLGW